MPAWQAFEEEGARNNAKAQSELMYELIEARKAKQTVKRPLLTSDRADSTAGMDSLWGRLIQLE